MTTRASSGRTSHGSPDLRQSQKRRGSKFTERTLPGAERAGAVYRMYDERGALLYIGSTGDVAQRIHTHMTHRWELSYSSEIHERFHALDVEWFPTIEDARAVEVEAIRSEAPLLNRKDNPKRWRHAGRAGYVAVIA